jgi:GNAT superfamily N-acetyltransferase
LIKIIRTNSENQDFINLVKKLDAYLKIADGVDHDYYNQFNNIDVLNHVVVVYKNNTPVGCGAFKKFNNSATEIKRMFVEKDFRGKGFAKILLLDLENWSKELNYKKCILETGKRQIEAVQFYKKCNYTQIPNFGQYKVMENSICFEKQL